MKAEAGSLSLQDQKIINALLFYSHDEIIEDDAVHEVTLQELREYLGGHESNDRVRAVLNNLAGVVLDFDHFNNDGERQWGKGSLITVSGHEKGQDGLVKFGWPHWLRPLLAEPAKWARLSMLTVRAFQSKYSVRLYENLESVVNMRHPHWVIDVADLRIALGVEDGKLAEWADFNKRAIKPAMKEVNQLADFDVEMHVARRVGRKVMTVRFATTKKEQRLLREISGRAAKRQSQGELVLKPETYEKARKYGAGYDIYKIEQEWLEYATRKGKPDNPDRAFINFVKVWVKRRQGSLF